MGVSGTKTQQLSLSCFMILLMIFLKIKPAPLLSPPLFLLGFFKKPVLPRCASHPPVRTEVSEFRNTDHKGTVFSSQELWKIQTDMTGKENQFYSHIPAIALLYYYFFPLFFSMNICVGIFVISSPHCIHYLIHLFYLTLHMVSTMSFKT